MTGQQWTVSLAVGDTLPLSPNYRLNRYVEARAKKHLRDQVRWLLRAQRVPRMERVHVQLHWTPKTRRTRDADNLMLCHKVAVDGMRDFPARWSLDRRRLVEPAWTGIVADDDPAHVTWDPPVLHDPDPTLRERLQLVLTDLSNESETP